MPEGRHRARRTSAASATLGVVGAALVLLGAVTIASCGRDDRAPSAAAAYEQVSSPGTAPARIRIPDLDVDAPVERLGLQPDRSLEVPEEPDVAGWWSGGSRPGEHGPTVIVAHRDSTEGPALFYELPMLDPGTTVVVEDGAGREHTYRVDRIEQHDRDAFPTAAVYGPTPRSTLRLLTCGGDYRPGTGYQDNYVVFATAVT